MNSNLLKAFVALADPRKNKPAIEQFIKQSVVIAKKIIFVTKASNKVYNPSLYKEAMSDLIHAK